MATSTFTVGVSPDLSILAIRHFNVDCAIVETPHARAVVAAKPRMIAQDHQALRKMLESVTAVVWGLHGPLPHGRLRAKFTSLLRQTRLAFTGRP